MFSSSRERTQQYTAAQAEAKYLVIGEVGGHNHGNRRGPAWIPSFNDCRAKIMINLEQALTIKLPFVLEGSQKAILLLVNIGHNGPSKERGPHEIGPV